MVSLRSYTRRVLDRVHSVQARPRTAFSVLGWVAVIGAVVWSFRRGR